jgi:NTP pyrophosphatase (non-canonical NTP hydrolase)
MDFTEYQREATKTAIYPKEKGLEYTALGLCSEAGEVAGKVKKIIRDKDGIVSEEDSIELAKELGDCIWYCAALANELQMDLNIIAHGNILKLMLRQEKGTIQGSGDNR